MRILKVTAGHVASLEESTNMFLSVGKAYFQADKARIHDHLEVQKASLTKTNQDLSDRKEYLERRIQSNMANIKELTGTA